jgi:hypothetical protein
MYAFHYETIKPLYGERAKLLFTDTDSLCYELTTKDVFVDMGRISDQLDTSDYPVDHPLFSRTNAKVIGKFKDECGGTSPKQFVGLRSKMYSLLLANDKTKATAKGIKTSFAKKKIKHADYYKCLIDSVETSASFENIRSKNHVLTTFTVRKRALSSFDDKRFLLRNTTDTLAHGHWRIKDGCE